MFEQSILVDPPKGRKTRALFVSLLAQITVGGVLLLVPLVYTDAITLFPEYAPPVMAPHLKQPEPPEIKPSQSKASPVRSVSRPFVPQVLQAPPSIPTRVVIITDAGAAPEVTVTGVPGGIITGPAVAISPIDIPRPVEPAPTARIIEPAAPKLPEVPVRISGGVQAAKLAKQVLPVYPMMASRARIQGTVRLHAIIGRDGKVRDLTVVDGHPFLRQAAVDAVKQWIYSPTILGTEAVEVDTMIEVNFVLK